MNSMLSLCLLASLLAAGPPKPEIISASWDLHFDYQEIQRIAIDLPGKPGPRTYWYLLYTVTNDTGRDIDFYPSFEIMTNRGRRIPNEIGVSPAVFRAVKIRHAPTHPFLQDQTQIIGRLLQTADQAREGVAIWPDFSPGADKFTIFVRGLSGESTEVPNPGFDPAKPETVAEKLADGTTIPRKINPRKWSLHKTLAIRYDLPGDPRTRSGARPVRTAQEWVMR